MAWYSRSISGAIAKVFLMLACDLRRLFFFLFIPALLLTSMPSKALAQCNRDKQQQAITALGIRVKLRFNDDHIPISIEGPIAHRVSADPEESALAVLRSIRDVYCASPLDDFVFARFSGEPREFGQTNVRIHQTYRGLEVFGPELQVELSHDSVTLVDGRFQPGINLSTKPAINDQDASQIAMEYLSEEEGTTNIVVKAVRCPVIFVRDRDAFLACKVRVTYDVDSQDRYQRGGHLDDMYIDAREGVLIGSYPLIIRD
jgi:Zn-dependent metalloprotease